MKTLKDIQHFEGVKVLLRADFNVPVRSGVVADDYRIQSALPTINFLTSRGAKVIIISHLEKAEGQKHVTDKGVPSLRPVADHLNKLGTAVQFIENYKDAHGVIENSLSNGGVILLENLRSHEGEKSNDQKFAKELASLGDIYVNEAFPAAHRAHASIVGVPKFLPGYAGLQFEKEVNHLSRAFHPHHPFLFILGGAKFETKVPLIQRFLPTADHIFVGGALANNMYMAKGYEVGNSIVSMLDIDFKSLADNPKILIPPDILNQDREIKSADSFGKSDKNMDAGPKTLELLKAKISEAKFILWNGPLGLYEEGYTEPTRDLAVMIAKATENGAETIVGGGDTVAAISSIGLSDKFTFVSTGGGAMLDFLAKETLPGIEALK